MRPFSAFDTPSEYPMAKTVMIEEFHLTIRVPAGVRHERVKEIRATLNGKDFLKEIRRIVRAAVRAVPELRLVRVSLTN